MGKPHAKPTFGAMIVTALTTVSLGGAASAAPGQAPAQARPPITGATGPAEPTGPYFCQNNSCRGKSECGGHGNLNACAGTNECKGKGWVTAADESGCKAKGGLWKKNDGKN
jgi:hypothetical protein